MGFSSTALMAAGAGMSAVGAMNKAEGQKATLGYEASVAGNNAMVAQWQAELEKEIGAQQEQTSRLRTGQIYGAQRTAMAANGVDLGEGSATDVLTTTKYMGERDALTIRDNAARRAWAYQNNAASYRSEQGADLAMQDAINPTKVGFTSLLSSAGSVAGSWTQNNRAGVDTSFAGAQRRWSDFFK